MPKRDRAAYMRAYRAKRAEGEGVNAPPPIRELDHRHRFTDTWRFLDGERTMGALRCPDCGAFDGPAREIERFGKAPPLPVVIQSMSQAERDRILRKLTK